MVFESCATFGYWTLARTIAVFVMWGLHRFDTQRGRFRMACSPLQARFIGFFAVSDAVSGEVPGVGRIAQLVRAQP